jgi:hypothetical protein
MAGLSRTACPEELVSERICIRCGKGNLWDDLVFIFYGFFFFFCDTWIRI